MLDLNWDFWWLEAVSSSSVDTRARGTKYWIPTASLFEFVRILMNFFRFFLIFEIFFFSFEKTIKSHEIWMFPQKDKSLHSRSFWIIDRNVSQIRLKHFSINGVFKNWIKIRKKSYVFGQIEKSILAKKKFHIEKSMFSAPSDGLFFFQIFSDQEVYKILSESHFWLGM